MNKLLIFASANDTKEQSNHAKLTEFMRLDKEIARQQSTLTLKERFHSLEYTLLIARAKAIVKELTA